MKPCLYLIASVLVLGLFSCSDDEEPISPLAGTWENRVFVDSLDRWIVETLEIGRDTSVQMSVTVRNSEDGSDLGYRSIFQSKGGIQQDVLSFSNSLDFVLEPVHGVRPIYVPKSELILAVVERTFASASVDISSNREEMDFQPLCFNVFKDHCPESKKFIKVD